MTSTERSKRADRLARLRKRCPDCHLPNERHPLKYCGICSKKRNDARPRWRRRPLKA